jgi:multiple sugar transport system substrate-binding protein
MFKQKRFFLLAALVITALLLTACPTAAPAGGEAAAGGGEQAAAPAADSSGGREIVWMVRTGAVENPWEENVVAPAWAAENPDIKLNILNIAQDEIAVKREAMIAAGEPLDVWSPNWGGDGFASDRNRGLLMDLTPLIERDQFDTSVFIPEVLAIYQSEGKTWALPFLTTGSYLFYNMNLFDAAGIPYPTTDWDDETWTWEAALDIAKQLTQNAEDPTTATYGWSEGIWPAEAITWLWGAHPWPEGAFESGFAQSVNFTSEGAVAAFQAKHDLVYKDKVAPDNAASQALAQLGGEFESGRVGMRTTGGWGWWVYTVITPEAEGGFCWGVAPLPYGAPGAENRSVIFTDPWVITRGLEGQRMEDAWSFIKFLVREDNARSYMQATNTPPTQSKLQEEWFQQFKCMTPEQVKEVYQGSFRHGLESSNHLMVRFDELSSTWDNLLGEYWNDPAGNAAEVLPQVEEAVNEVLTRIAEEAGFEFK